MKIKKTTNKAALFMALMGTTTFAVPDEAYADFDAKTYGAVKSVEAGLIAQSQALLDHVRRLGGQLTGNLKENLGAEANMKQLADERARQREIERVKFEALKNATSTKTECVIRTRAVKSQSFNRPDKRLSAATLETLEQMAAWNLGAPVGGSGNPKQTGSRSQKEELFLQEQAKDYCDPAMVELGLCEAPAEPKYQGASYVAIKGIFSSDNYEDETIENSCQSFAKNIQGMSADNVSNVSPESSVSNVTKASAYITDTARKSLSNSVIMGYCADRSPSMNKDDASQEHVIATAKEIAGYTEEELQDGISYSLAFQIRSQEWYSKPKPSYNTEVQALNEISYILGWMAFQNNEIYKKLDKMTVLQAAQLGTANESLLLQKESGFNSSGASLQ